MSDKSVIASLQAQIDSIVGTQAEGARSFAPQEKRSALTHDSDPQQDNSEAALKKIIALVNVSDRSEKSIRERLEKGGFSACAIDDAVSRAKDFGFIDDARFSEVLVRSRISQGRGSAGIVRELAEHGIDPTFVPGWPCEYPLEFEDELIRALDLLGRKPPRSKNLREGAYRRLMQRGYPSSVASSAARIWSEDAQHA